MKIRGKIPAFTIVEITVSMIIAAISIAIAFTAYTILNKSYLRYDKTNKNIAELLVIDKQLKADFMSAVAISNTEAGILIQTGQGVIVYQLNDKFILRDQYGIRTDTFNLPVRNIIIHHTEQVSLEEQLVDKLRFKTTIEDRNIDLSYTKLYSSADLIHRNTQKN